MSRETQVRVGTLPQTIAGEPMPELGQVIFGGQFAMRTSTGYGFHYGPGRGVLCERGADADPDEFELWLNGSVYAAVACLNGLYPLHASAVAWNGRVHAFTGPSGAGKSTLVAGLGQAGLPLFCDDTLLLVLDDPERVVALPGHKRLKLTESALALTGARSLGRVGADTHKDYAAPSAGTLNAPLELASLTFLAEGDRVRIEPLRGAARFAALEDDHYTQDYYLRAQQPARADLFAVRARLAANLAMARLVRPFTLQGFAMSVDIAKDAILAESGEVQT